MLKITLKRSLIGRPEKQKRIVRALGLRGLNKSVIHDANPTIRGMINKISHMVSVEELEEGSKR